MLRMIFRPQGVEPRREEFKCMTFDTWDQIARYLQMLERPSEEHPWVLENGKIIAPGAIMDRLPK